MVRDMPRQKKKITGGSHIPILGQTLNVNGHHCSTAAVVAGRPVWIATVARWDYRMDTCSAAAKRSGGR
jgi:hypothetical protein